MYGIFDEIIGIKEYLHGPTDAAKLKFNVRAGGSTLQERRRRFRNVGEDDKYQCFRCKCGNSCDERIHVL